MGQKLVIVESPAKAKTIKKYLGSGYEVLASYGHVRDLPGKAGSVDPDNNFATTYLPIERNSRHIDAISKALKKSTELLLATDPDREGEAISWHVYELMQAKKLLKDKVVKRIFFNEITKTAIQEAISNPREIATDLVNAQQARRILDYLVGFNLSPLLWKKIRRDLSAGRVQSPALRLIVEREEEIENFKAREYWSIVATCFAQEMHFTARLTKYNDKKIEQFTVVDEQDALDIRKQLLEDTAQQLTVFKVDKKQRKRRPAPCFITSTLQQEASRKIGFTARKAMMVAQQLYEGIDIGTGSVGLITYMRTDSVNIAQEAIIEIRTYISQNFEANFLPKEPRFYKTKSKNAQEAHEAIRPTSVKRNPQTLSKYLTSDQLKLYSLIWKRTIACQMSDALIDTVAMDLSCKEHIFRANGSSIAFRGFLAIYEEGRDDLKDAEKENILPKLVVADLVKLEDIAAKQHFTEPPPRFSEASLVKSLEEFGIGRPSTYATIIHTLQQREYVVSEKKRFIPTDIGRIVNKFLTKYFTRYVDYEFTANLENTLDDISRGEKDFKLVLAEFWQPFIAQIKTIDETVQRKDVTTEIIEEKCPKCAQQLSIRLGKRGRFIGCTAYPECDYTQDMGETSQPEVLKDRSCPECKHDLLIKKGKYGKFIGCSNYPACKFMEPLDKPSDTNVKCPECKKDNILKRKSRRGKIFYSCQGYPKCKYALWNEPLNQPCPECGFEILTLKESKRFGKEHVCPQPECKFKKQVSE